MKKQLAILMLILAGALSSHAQKLQQKIGTNPTLIVPSAALELESTTKGFLPPRMTAAQRDAIVNPVAGLMVWCTDCGESGQVQTYNGSTWTGISGSPIITIITSLNCAGATHNGALIPGTAASGVSSVLPYTGGNGGTYAAQNIASTGVTGLTATLTAGTVAYGVGSLTYIITGTPLASGTASFAIGIGGQSCTLTRTVILPAMVSTLDCAGATDNGALIPGTAASGVSSVLPYTGGNGGVYAAQSIASTGVTGLTATLTAGTVVNGAGSLTYTITGTPSATGTASFAISIGGQSCTLTRPVFIPDRAYGQTINGANNHNFVYNTVTGADGNTWLNNNLGAHYANVNHASYNPDQQATSATDHLAYGSLFQWGRGADGHELITWTNGTTGTAVNGTTATLSSGDTPGNNLFIFGSPTNNDWRNPQNDNLWQGVNGINNPCPIGYRVPTSTEMTALVTAAGITNSATAYSSTLKFTVPGVRNASNGVLGTLGAGYYWSSTVNTYVAYSRSFYNAGSGLANSNRGHGETVRCLKN